MIPRELTKEEVRRLKSQKRNPRQQRIAVDAIALIVNKENPVEIISMKELREILSGEITRWDEIEPSKLGTIQAVFDENGSSTAQYMRDSLLNGGKFGENVFAEKLQSRGVQGRDRAQECSRYHRRKLDKQRHVGCGDVARGAFASVGSRSRYHTPVVQLRYKGAESEA